MADQAYDSLFKHLSCFFIPEQKVKLSHRNFRLLGKGRHLPLDLQVDPFCRRTGNLINHAQKRQIFENMPVKDSQILSKADVSQEMAGFLITEPLDIFHQPFPCSRGLANPASVALRDLSQNMSRARQMYSAFRWLNLTPTSSS